MIDIDIWDAFMAVKSYCLSNDECVGCPLYHKDCCIPPFFWDIEEKVGEEE